MLQLEPVKKRLAEPLKGEVEFGWLCRIMAIYALLSGISYAAGLIGLNIGGAMRFDLMPDYWRLAAIVLVCLMPAAGLGLWSLSSWGGVLWCAAATIEVVMYAVFPDLFGARPILVGFNIIVSIIYGALGFWLFRQEVQARKSIR